MWFFALWNYSLTLLKEMRAPSASCHSCYAEVHHSEMVHRRTLSNECLKWMQRPSSASGELALLQGFAFSHCGRKPLLDAIILVLREGSAGKQSCFSRSHSLWRFKSGNTVLRWFTTMRGWLLTSLARVTLGFLEHSSLGRRRSGLSSPGMKLLLQCLGTVKLAFTKHMLLA